MVKIKFQSPDPGEEPVYEEARYAMDGEECEDCSTFKDVILWTSDSGIDFALCETCIAKDEYVELVK